MFQNNGRQPWQDELARKGLETGKPLSSKIVIKAAQDRIWEKLSEPGYLKKCHPFCDSTEVEKWPGVGSRDSITYYSGRTYRRNFVEWFDGIGYDIELGLPPDQTCRVLWRIDPQSRLRRQILVCFATISMEPMNWRDNMKSTMENP